MSTSVSTPQRPDTSPADVTPGAAASGAPVARRERTIKRGVVFLFGLFVIGVLFLLIRLQGFVRGVEFAPSHFQLRRFSFYEIPLIHVQITPIRRRVATPNTADYLRLNSLIKPTPGPPSSWHLVSISRGISPSTPAPADLLISQLEMGGHTATTDEYWRVWSEDHPQHARIFWPVIQKLALRELYVLMPPLFELAQTDLAPTELQFRLEALLKRQYASLIEDLRGAGRSELADQLLEEAIGDFPSDEDLLILRSKQSH